MKQLLILILISFIGKNAFSQNDKLKTDWLIVYYMPYDNNLSVYGEPIIKMIGDSLKSKKIIAAVQADFRDTLGMERYIITEDSTYKTQISNEYSASSDSYEQYLKWIIEKVIFNKLAIVFLDHGGKLDQVCLDEKPKYQFLKVDSLKQVFIKILGKNKIDLLFLQVCSKGAIEPLYEFKDVAKYTLCSQIELGAPNYYYHGLFSKLSQHFLQNGIEMANEIVNNERYDMYSSYTLIDNSKLDSLNTLFYNLINKIQEQTGVKLKSIPLSSYYFQEKYWDIISFLENIDIYNYPEFDIQKKQLINFITTKLILFHKINQKRDRMKTYSGLNISAVNTEGGTKYNNLQFYKLLSPIRKLAITK